MVEFEIVETLAEISSTSSTKKLLTLTSWNRQPAKLDLRTWREVDGSTIPGKGITLTGAEAAIARDALVGYLNREGAADGSK